MQGYFAIAALALLICCVIARSHQLKKFGIQAIKFGKMDKKDFLIPPFVLFYLYLIIANTFGLPKVGNVLEHNQISSQIAAWVGATLCVLAPALFLWALISFGKSFRVGIDMDTPGKLVQTGAFAISRNPLYLAFFMILTGIFLIFPSWIFFAYLMGGLWLIDRQVCLEENALREIYGEEYNRYCERIRRYL